MKNIMKIMLFSGIAIFFFSIAGFSQFYQLDGKWVQLHGPAKFGLLGVAETEAGADRLIAAAKYGDPDLFAKVLEDYSFFRVRNNASAMVLEVKLFENKAKVMVFDDHYKDESGWVPLDWLCGNSGHPLFVEVVKKSEVNYPVSSPFEFYKHNPLFKQ